DDPFDLIDHALLKDGSTVSAAELRRGLLGDGQTYRADYESRIEALVWKPGTVAFESDDVKQIGAWDYDQLDHAERREVRGGFVLAAWVDQCNMRWENTRLAYVKRSGEWELQH